MNKSSAPVPTSSSPEDKLDLPVADFDSRPPRLDPQVMLARCQENMPWRNAQPRAKQRRLAEKIPVEFVL
jgi:hypothetical protein